MTEENEQCSESLDQNHPPVVVVFDIGDAMLETKQQSPSFLYPDCLFAYGTKYGC